MKAHAIRLMLRDRACQDPFVSHTPRRRFYRGLSPDQRRALRRQAFIDTGREVWCQDGWAAVTMRRVCAQAGLTDRYFYESFADRDALLVAIGQSVRDETVSHLVSSLVAHAAEPPQTQLRAAITLIVDLINEDPGSAQIFFGDHGGNTFLEDLRRTTIDSTVNLFLAMARPNLAVGADELGFRVALLIGIGGFVETVTAWRSGHLDISSSELIEALMGVAQRLGDGFINLA